MSIQFFLRFGQLEHLQQLLSSGHVYINRAKFFKKDLPHPRFDKNEGKLSISHLADAYIDIRPKGEVEWKKLNVQKGVFENSLNLEYTYIYSLFSILETETRESEFFEFSDDIKKMGKHFIIIRNPKEFMTRMLTALEKNSYCYEHGVVNYYDPQLDHKNLGLFHKGNQFQAQKEYRIAIGLESEGQEPQQEHIQFNIGSLEDIAEICETNQYRGLQFKWE